jgi:hypothetical protein
VAFCLWQHNPISVAFAIHHFAPDKLHILKLPQKPLDRSVGHARLYGDLID